MITPEGEPLTFALVIPTHRRPEFIRQAVDSALRQERPFDQIIVVADGADDPAPDVLAGMPVDVQPIAKAGVAAARNAGLSRVEADWACFLDDDDLLHPAYLRDLETAIRATPTAGAFNAPYWSFGAVAGQREEFEAATLDECLEAVKSARPRNDMTYLEITGHSFDALLAGLAGSMSTAAVRADILRRAGGFPEGFVAAEDWTMYVNVARYTEWHVLTERRAFFREHGGNAMRGASTGKALAPLRAIRTFWQPTQAPVPRHRPLSAYGRHYRNEVLNALEIVRRVGDRAAAAEVRAIAAEILPRRWDRLYVRMPRPVRSILWRTERVLRLMPPRASEGQPQ